MTAHQEYQQSRPVHWMTSVALALAVTLASPAVDAGRVVIESSRIGFTATQSEVAVDGRFKSFTADVDFNPAKPATGAVKFAVEPASVTTGSSDADELLKGSDFFDVARFPRATFVSKTIGPLGAGTFQAIGQFSLKGHSAEIAIPFTAQPEGGGLRIEGHVPLSRLAFGVGTGQWADTGLLADQVQIRFSLYVPASTPN